MKLRYITIVLLAFTVSACTKKQEEKIVAPTNVAVEVASSVASTANRSYVGEVEAGTTTSISSLQPGTLLKVYVEEGQNVSAGQLIAQLDPTQARNAVQAAQAVLHQAEDAHQRMKVLHEKNAISEIDWVSVESKLQQAQSSVAMAEKALADCRVVSPCSGVIGKKYVQSGMNILPSQPICNVLDVKSVKVKVSVPEKEIGIFNANTKTQVKVNALNATFEGGKVEIGVVGSSISRSYSVFVNLANQNGKLRPGMVCDVTLDGTVAQGEDAALVSLPVTAVHRRATGDMFVWKVVDGKAHRVKVVPGLSFGDRIQLAEGVAAGDQIIVEGYQKLSEGSEVNIKEL